MFHGTAEIALQAHDAVDLSVGCTAGWQVYKGLHIGKG